MARMSVGRKMHACAVISKKILVMGGLDRKGDCLDSVEYYDPATNEWFPAAPMLEPRYEHKAVTHNDFVYVLGGCNSRDYGSVESVDRYSLCENKWTRVSYSHI